MDNFTRRAIQILEWEKEHNRMEKEVLGGDAAYFDYVHHRYLEVLTAALRLNAEGPSTENLAALRRALEVPIPN